MAELDKKRKFPVLAVRGLVVFPSTVIPLYVERASSMAAIEKALDGQGQIVCLSQKNPDQDIVKARDVYRFGTIAKILQAVKLPDGNMKLLIEGGSRVKVEKLEKSSKNQSLSGLFSFVEEPMVPAELSESLMRILQEKFGQFLRSSEQLALDVIANLASIGTLTDYADLISAHLPIATESKQALLEMVDVSDRVNRLLILLEQETRWQSKEKEMLDKVRDEINEDQQSYYIRKKMKIFEEELKKMDEGAASDSGIYEQKIKALKLAQDLEEKFLSEAGKLKQMSEMSAEATVIRNYLDIILGIPWNKLDKINDDLKSASRMLNRQHYGLPKVKERILESLAVSLRVAVNKAPILCFVGAPGVGKTSLGKSVADAMGRSFVRIALGGVRDESEIRGHRRTYIGALPGQIVRALTKAKSMNPVIMLDEIDKMGMDFRGDPASALLEVLDPEQNKAFNDHYTEIDIDLSNVLFITTANSLDIPPALMDRMEIIHLSGYTEQEKLHIAKKHLLKECLKDNGLSTKELTLTEDAILSIIQSYTREAGVRNLKRDMSKICRKVVRQNVTSKELIENPLEITSKDLEKYLGVVVYENQDVSLKPKVGVVNGLAWTSSGGELLNIEAASFPGKGDLIYTGSLGEVMQESIRIAHSVVRGVSKLYKIKKGSFSDRDYHIHVPEGATPKDGPSAGIGMATVLLSVTTNQKIKNKIAMTGELTLSGEVLPIGGLKEKILAAIRSGVNEVIIPKGNKKDLNEFKKDINGKIDVYFVSDILEVFKHAFVK
jgi:ATP-dependent Lon protease